MNTFLTTSFGALFAAAALATVGVGSAAAAPDYGTLPVDPNLITDSTAYAAMPPVLDPDGRQGVQQVFSHRDGTREITTTIMVLPNPQEATGSIDAVRADLAPIVIEQGSQTVPVGAGGTFVSGASPDGTQAVGVLLFTQGDAAVEVEFTGPADDPVPVDLVTQYGQDQVAAIDRQLGT